MDPHAPQGREGRPEDGAGGVGEDPRPARRGRGTRPSPEAKAARRQGAEARKNELARKKRTRELISMGGVLAAWGFSTPAQVEEIIAALVRTERGHDRLLGLGVERTERWDEARSTRDDARPPGPAPRGR